MNLSDISRKKWSHKFNEFREEGNTLYIKVKDREVIIDKEDFEKLYPSKVGIFKTGYAYTRDHAYVHRIVTECPKGLDVDHINHNKLDNRKCNLRIVSRSENAMNAVVKSNTGEYGITKRKDGRYMVTVNFKYQGIRKTLDEAIALRNKSIAGTKQAEVNYFLGEGV